MRTLTFTLFLSLGILVMQGQGVLRYNFNDTFAETNGMGPSLAVLGNQGVFLLDTLNEISGKTKTVYRFEKNSGFMFDDAAAGNFLGNNYTIELYFVFDELQSWKRVIDWKNRKTDKGAYVYYGQLNFYNYVYSGEAPVLPGEYTYYVVTRDGATKKLLIYTDASVQIDFIDNNDEGVIDEDHVLNFFYDDLVVPNEASSGAVAMLNLYNYILDSATIKHNFDNLNSQVFSVKEKNLEYAPFRVYPNPASDLLSVDVKKILQNGPVNVSLYDMTGTRVFDQMIMPGDDPYFEIDTGSYPEGIYLVKSESGSKVFSRKVIIRH